MDFLLKFCSLTVENVCAMIVADVLSYSNICVLHLNTPEVIDFSSLLRMAVISRNPIGN